MTAQTANAQTKAASAPKQKAASKSAQPKTMAELLAQADYTIVVPRRGETVTGRITRKGKKALYVDIGAKTEGIVADKEFEAAREYIDELEAGSEIEVIVASVENNQGQVLLSLRKAAADARWEYFEQAQESEEVLEALGVDVNKGGLIVSVNGVRGFIPSSQFGKELVGSYQQLKGKKIKVRAIEVDRDKNRLIFSERHVSEADEIAKKEEALESVKINEVYEGVVSGVMHFGLFVTVEVSIPGSKAVGHVEGLVHISEISWEKVTHPKEYHAVGDRLKVRVLGVDDKTGKLNLSIKQLSDDPWKNIDKRYPVGTTVEGTVSRVEPFGVFVNVEPGIDGLIHQSKLEPGQTFQRGEKLTVHVESVSPEQKRMSLSVVMTELPVAYK
jgi:small subunit ribosomal protein S1